MFRRPIREERSILQIGLGELAFDSANTSSLGLFDEVGEEMSAQPSSAEIARWRWTQKQLSNPKSQDGFLEPLGQGLFPNRWKRLRERRVLFG